MHWRPRWRRRSSPRLQTQDLLSYLEEHGIEVLAPGESGVELHPHAVPPALVGHQ